MTRIVSVRAGEGSRNYRRLVDEIEGNRQYYRLHPEGVSIWLHEVESDPVGLSELLLSINRMDPHFRSHYNSSRQRPELSSGLEVSFRVDGRQRAERKHEAFGNALANISIIDPWYELHSWPPQAFPIFGNSPIREA